MNMHSRLVACGAALILAAACGQPERDGAAGAAAGAAEVAAAPSAVSGVELAVAAAQSIQANPSATDSILVAHGLTRAGFDSLMYEIAADPARARSYAEAISGAISAPRTDPN